MIFIGSKSRKISANALFAGRYGWMLPPLLLLLGMTFVMSFYLFMTVSNGKAVSQQRWAGKAMILLQGDGVVDSSGLTITKLSKNDVGLGAFLGASMRADDYPVISWKIDNLPRGSELFMVWRTSGQMWKMRPIDSAAGNVVTLNMRNDAEWHGNITDIGLLLRGGYVSPWKIYEVILHPVSVSTGLIGMASDWFGFRSWTGGSIHFLYVDAPDARLSLLLFVGASLVLIVTVVLILAFFRLLPSASVVIGALVVMSWLIVDARWQFNLFRQHGVTGRQYAGKTWEEKHLAAEDGKLFHFIQEVKAHLPPPPVRVLFSAGEAYLNGRGNYHLYPHNVFRIVNYDGNYGAVAWVPAPGLFRKGDYIVLYEQTGIRFDALKGVFFWSGGERQAELVFSNGGNMLLRVI